MADVVVCNGRRTGQLFVHSATPSIMTSLKVAFFDHITS